MPNQVKPNLKRSKQKVSKANENWVLFHRMNTLKAEFFDFLSWLQSRIQTPVKLLTLSWRRTLSYRNQSIDLLRKLMDWFLYDNGLRHERVMLKLFAKKVAFSLFLQKTLSKLFDALLNMPLSYTENL